MVRNPNATVSLWLGLIVCVVTVLGHLNTGLTQDPTPPNPTAPSTTVRSDYDDTAKPTVVTPMPTSQPQPERLRPLSKTEHKQLRQASDAAMALVRESEQAFDRGLMSLQDHLLQLQTADDVVLSAAGLLQNDNTALRQVLRHRVERLQTLRLGYQGLNNYWPVAPGDQALVETLLAQAEAELIGLEDEREIDRHAAASARVVDWSDRLVHATELEVFTGSGTPEEKLQARRIRDGLDIPPEDVAALQTAIRDQRDEQAAFVRQLERWSQVGSPLGRADRLAAAKFELARLDYDLANLTDSPSARSTAFRDGMQSSAELHAALAEYYQVGTASLFDLATAWQQRRGMAARFASDTETVDPRLQRRLSQDFQEIQQLATNTRDRRGRIAADTQFINVLGNRDVIDRIANARTNTRR
ncbi:hypothetical protein [Thalassoroseus pseudoceratinae]|uniref:hypothetical protein n=1 Tax=Thalassoroseus pseudoceratinae TaxID=2713176 RepID=UPI00142196E7|nr:hypothetical protein [Thalassoroseus pseudoceratinae]